MGLGSTELAEVRPSRHPRSARTEAQDFGHSGGKPCVRMLTANSGFTDSLQHILKQIPLRALDRGLGLSIADHASIVMLALWSVLLWEHKVGLIALEQAGVERFNLVRDLDRLLREKQSELPDVRDGQYTFNMVSISVSSSATPAKPIITGIPKLCWNRFSGRQSMKRRNSGITTSARNISCWPSWNSLTRP